MRPVTDHTLSSKGPCPMPPHVCMSVAVCPHVSECVPVCTRVCVLRVCSVRVPVSACLGMSACARVCMCTCACVHGCEASQVTIGPAAQGVLLRARAPALLVMITCSGFGNNLQSPQA